MQTILYVSSMTLGTEVQVRQIHEGFPVAALNDDAGVEKVKAFIGSGYYALELTFNSEDGDFQERFHEFLRLPEIQSFFEALRPYIDELPTPDAQTAELPLATQMLFWERES